MKLASKALVGIGLTFAVMAIGCGGRVTEPGGKGSSGAAGTSGATGAGGSSGAGGTSGATGAGGTSGVGDDAGGPCSSKHSASCVCVCADPSGDSGCVNQVCPFSEAYCFGPSAGCPPGQVCSVYGDICTPVCGHDEACPEGMMALHLLP